MRPLPVLSVALACLLAIQASADGGPRPVERRRLIDVEHVALDLGFDFQKKQAAGSATLTLRLLRPSDQISLDAGQLTIESIALKAGAALQYSYDGGDADDALTIKLDRPYAAGEIATIVIRYRTNKVNEADPNSLSGSNGKGLRFFSPTATEPIKRKQIWSMGEPASNRYWFPGYDAPDDLRTFEMKATVETPLAVISNGVLISTTSNSDGTRTFHWKMDTPQANHQTAFVAGEYVDVKQDAAGVDLHSYAYPDERQAAADSVVRLPDMVRFFSEITGAKYPYASYSQVFAQDMPWGVSSAGLSTLTENMVDDYPTHEDYRYLWDGLSGETLARQWFTSQVTARDWKHVWLDRAFGHYFDGLYSEHKNGRGEFLLWHMLGDHNFYIGTWKSGLKSPVVATGSEDPYDFTNSPYPYTRGGMVLHMLRKHIGEAAWSRTVKRYVAANAGGTVTTDDFKRAAEEASGETLGWFFDQWVYKVGHPVFVVTKAYDAALKRLTLTVRQTQTPDPKATYPQAEFFEGKLDVEIDGRVEQVWLDAKAENTFVFASEALPKIVGFDHENTWIKELTFSKPLDELAYQARNDTDVTGQRFAIAEMAAIAKQTATSAVDQGKVQAALRDVATGPSFWRIKYIALLQLNGLLTPMNAADAVRLDAATINAMLAVIKNEKTWVRSVAVSILGLSRDPKFATLFVDLLRDGSHPVTYAAGISLGKTRSPKAFVALTDVMKVPSWKGENILTGLAGLKELGDPRATEVALKRVMDQKSPRWFLATSRWDFRIAAAETLAALGKGSIAYPVVLDRFRKSMIENDINDIFSNVLLVATLADPRGQEVFDALKPRFKDDANAMAAADGYEKQFKDAIAKR